jgi:GGDEF domain-containing protein
VVLNHNAQAKKLIVERMQQEFSISSSMGIARSADIGRDFDVLLHCAELAFHVVKRNAQKNYYSYAKMLIEG